MRGSLYRLLLTSSVIQFALIYPLVSYPLVTDRVYFLFILYYGETGGRKEKWKRKKEKREDDRELAILERLVLEERMDQA